MNPDVHTPDCVAGPEGDVRACPVVCPLSQLGRGCHGRVVGVGGAHRVRRRLLALGVRPSADVHVLGRLAQRGPFELRVGTVHLMLREHEAREVMVETTGAGHAASSRA